MRQQVPRRTELASKEIRGAGLKHDKYVEPTHACTSCDLVEESDGRSGSDETTREEEVDEVDVQEAEEPATLACNDSQYQLLEQFSRALAFSRRIDLPSDEDEEDEAEEYPVDASIFASKVDEHEGHGMVQARSGMKCGHFIAAEADAGVKAGMAFKTCPYGLGYYTGSHLAKAAKATIEM